MSGEVCLIMTPKLEELYNKLQSKYPKECEASLVNKNVFLGWVELCQKNKKENPNYIPSLNEIVHTAEKYKNMDGKSFLHLSTNTAVQGGINSNNEDAIRFAIGNGKVNNSLETFKKNVEKLKDISKDFSKKDSMPIEIQKLPASIFTMLKEHFTQHRELTESDYEELSKHIGFRPDGSIYNKQIVQELVDHLKAKGAKVIGREAMKEYLKKHPNILQAIEGNREIQDIKAKAIADGTFMKAPNGKPTNLTERQWLQVRTKNFINWFGDWMNNPSDASKVVDENGEPLVVYHHTGNSNLTEFSTDFDNYFAKDGGTKEAIFFDENKTRTLNRKYDIPVFLNIKDLHEYNETKEQLHHRGTTYRQVVNESAAENNIDGGVHMKDFDDNKMKHQSIWIVHNSNQIKSATDNNGMFSTENDDIRMFIGKKVYGNPLTKDLYYAENQYEKTIQQINRLERELNDNIYEDSISTKNGSIKIVQNERSKDSSEYDKDTITLSSGRSIFDRVSISIQANVSKNLIGGSILFPSLEINNPNNNYLRLENPIRSNHASLLKTVLQYFIDNGHDKPHTQWTLYAGGKYGKEYNYKGRIKNLNKVLGVDVSPYFQFEMRDGKEENTVEERVIIDAKGLIEALPTLVDTKAFSKLIDVLQSNEQNNVDYTLKRKNLTQQLHKLNEQKDEEWKKVQDIKKKIKNELETSSDLPFFITPEGEIYGFVDKDNNIYLDESIIDYSHPVHEYTHIWDRIVAKNYPDFWKQGVKLFKELDLWKEIENDENYGKVWKQIKGMTQDRLDNLIASEVHARVAGKMAEKEISDLANSKSSHKNIIEELKKWYEKFWEYVSKLVLGNNKVNSRSKISSIAKMTLGDFLSDANINQVNSNNIESFMHEFGTAPLQESEPVKISYTYGGMGKQIYTVKGSHIYNKDDKEVFAKDSKDRRKIFANLAVQQKRAVVVDYKGKQYVVNNRQQIISVTTGNEMQWGEENGDRKEIIRLAKIKFKELTKNSTSSSIIQKHRGDWSRQEAINNPRILYVFTDNTDRDSGSGVIPADSWYSKKYGAGHHFPTMTAAVVRGLDNSRPISTQRWYHQGAKGKAGNWTDADVEEFKAVIRDELQEIVNEFNTGKYDTIMFPDGDGLFNTRISAISKTRTPKLYQALADLLHEYGFDSLIPSDVKPTQQVSFDISNAEFYSGAADGSDKEWATQARALGIKVTDYTRESWNKLSQEWKDKLASEYEEVAKGLARPIIPIGNRGGIEVRRDMMQADKADAIFAIGTVVKPNEKGAKYTNKSNHDVIDGGTGYATQRGIIRGIPVYVFDQSDNQWKVWDSNTNAFVATEEPALTPHAATIGTRNINEYGKAAIKSVLQKAETTSNSILNGVKETHTAANNTSTLNITPAKPVDKKAAVKGSISNKFIGFAEGIAGSSTAKYARQAGDKANVGSYNVNDVVFVSIPGLRGNETVRHQQQDKTIAEALKALEAGATLVTDNKAYTQNSTYNEGEKKLAKALEKAGAVYSEKIVNNQTLGIWILPSTNNTSLSNVTVYNSSNLVDETPELVIQKKEVKEISNPRSEAIKSALNVDNDRNKKYHEAFSPRQIADLGEHLANVFSLELDNIEWTKIHELEKLLDNGSLTNNEKEEVRETLNKFKDPVKGRQLIAQEYGIGNLVNDLIKHIEGSIESSRKFETDKEVQLWTNVKEYFNEIFNEQVTLNIEEAEGIRIVDLEFKESEEEEDNDSEDDTSQYTNKDASGWIYKVRYTDPASTLSKKVKRLFSGIEKKVLVIDKDGKGEYVEEKNSIGLNKCYSTSQVYATFLSYFSNNVKDSNSFMHIYKTYDELVEAMGEDEVNEWIADDEEDFKDSYPYGYPLFPAFEEMKKQYPWVGEIQTKLEGDFWKDSPNPTYGLLSSQLYAGLKLTFIPYDKLDKDANKLKHLNHDMAEQAMLEKLKTNYYNGITLTNTSIYNSDGSINIENLKTVSKHKYTFTDTDDYLEVPTTESSEEEKKEFYDAVEEYYNYIRSFGIDIDTNAITALIASKRIGKLLERLGYIQEVINDQIESGKKTVDTFDYMVDVRHPNSGVSLWQDLFSEVGVIVDDQYIQSFYDSATKKTKYSYSVDNCIMKTFRGIEKGSQEERRKFIDEHFGKYEWFRNQKTGEWRNYWLDYFYDIPDGDYTSAANELSLPPYKNVDNVETESSGRVAVRNYVKWTAEDIYDIQQAGYDQKKAWAFYLAPIFSDSPMSLMVRGPKFTMKELLHKHSENRWEGTDLLKIERRGAFVDLVRQESHRIKYETERQAAIKEGKILPIDNFDQGKGLEFCFLPELNDFKINGKTLMGSIHEAQKDLATDDEIDDIIRVYVTEVLEPKFQEYFSKNMKDFDKLTESDKEDLRVRYYNMIYANASMIQLLTVDLAFYKNFIDFQKRFKEVYSGGTQLNTNSRYGKKTERVVILRDIVITSPSYSQIAAAIDKNQNLSKEDKEYIKSVFKNVNVADAQAIRSMHSHRSVMDMLGEWTPECDRALENFKHNNWSKADFDIVFQIIKPFVFGVIDTPDGLGNNIPMPVQHKNSEVCALMMYDLITNGLNNSPVYKALSRFMNEVVDSDGEPIADMIQFESASKVCNQGVINLNFNPAKTIDFIKSAIKGDNKYGIKIKPLYDENRKEIAVNRNSLESYYDHLKESLDNLLDKKELSQEDYSNIIQSLRPTEDEIIDMLKDATTITDDNGRVVINEQRVKEIPFEYYSKVQPVPLHHEDAKVPHGSQERNLAVADITDDTVIELKGKGENTKKYKGQDIIDFYYQLLNENLLEDYFGIDGEGGLAGIFKSKKSFAEAIKDVVRGNPKYDRGFMEAMEIQGSDFALSPNSPTMFSAIQSIVTAFFRDRITKQKINGATLVQAAGVGLDKDLRLKFDDNGKLVGMECYLPVTSKALFEPLITIDENGNKILDPKKLEEFGLTEAIGYRIPTENKSSMAPLIIKGFTPIQNGSMIVLPAEITALAGSDFDVDKMFLILSSFGIRNYSMEKAWEDYKKENNIKINILSDLPIEKMSEDEFFSYLKEIGFDEAFNKWFNKRTGEKTVSGRPIRNKDKYLLKDKQTGEPKPEVFAIKYDFNKSPKENGKKARNNMILQITHQLLCSKAGTEAFLNPQGFKDVEDAANLMRILHAFGQGLEEVRELIPGDTNNEKLMAISKLKSKELSKIAEKIKDSVAPVYPQTFAKLHAQNMAGVEQLGIYAIQASMSAKYQRAKINIKPHLQFSINGRTIARADVSMNGKTVKNTNQMVGAAADNGKNPNLTAMGSTNKTATIIGTLLREGLTHKEAALIVNSPYMNLSKRELAKVLKGKLPVTNNVTTDMLIRVFADPYGDNGIANDSDIVNVMALCYKVQCQHQSMEYINNVSRADSPNGGMKNSYAGCRVQRYKVDVLQAMMSQKSFAFEPIKETLSNDAIDMTGSEDEIREQLNNQKMGLLHGMYALGINSFDSLTKDFFFGSQKWFDDMIVKPILYNIPIDTSDNALISTVNSIYKAYVIYRLSDSKLFGDDDKYTMEEKRKYYTEKFPENFRKMISTNEEVRNLLGNIFTVKMGRIMLLDAGNMNKKQIAVVRDRVGALRYSDSEEVRRLATDLLLYSYYDNGLQYSNTSIASAFSIDFLISFDEYNKALKNMNTKGSDEDSKNFIYQFLSYNNIVPKTIPSELKNDLRWDKSTGDLLIMNNGKDTVKKMTDTVLSPNPNYDLQMYPYVMWMGQIYVFDKEATENTNYNSLVYHRVPSYINSKERPRFNSNLKVSDLESLYSITAKEEMRKQNKDAHDEGLIQEAKNRQGLGKVEDKNMLYDYEGIENEPFNYMDIATQDYDMDGQDKSDLLDEEAFKKPGYLDTLGEFVEDLLENGDIKTIDINPSDEELNDSQYSKEGNDTLDTQMCIG